jgi:hypothetical protein
MTRWLRALAPALWLFAMAAQAQQPAPPAAPPAAATPRVKLTLEQEHVIKELVKELKLDPATVTAKEVGDALAPGAPLHDMPAGVARKAPQVKAHRFVYTAERILIVDPKDNRVSEVIELN